MSIPYMEYLKLCIYEHVLVQDLAYLTGHRSKRPISVGKGPALRYGPDPFL